jgi:hypothetical protein
VLHHRQSSSATWWWKGRGGAATVGNGGSSSGIRRGKWYMRRILEGKRNKWRELPFCDRHRGSTRCSARCCFARSPRACLGRPGMAWVRMD